MKKIQSDNKSKKTAAVILAAIALGVFATDNSVAGTEGNMNGHVFDICSEEFCCDDDLCEHEFDADYQILVANKNPLVKWVCSACGQRQQRAKSAGRPAPGKCPRKKNGAGHSWVRD